MEKKHSTCRWKSEKIKSKKYFILAEGFRWLRFVYFQKEKSLIDADIEFFETLINQYEEILKIKNTNIFSEDICIDDLEKFFNRAKRTINRAIIKMINLDYNYKYFYNGKYFISKEGIEWLCKNCFKKKYLELLENYKMELTEKYIKAGYIYDNFFGLN